MKVAAASSCLAVMLGICGCRWLNGDPLWLWSGQKSVTVRKRVSTLFDTQYDLKSGNMPFTFVADGGDVELGLFGHVRGCPDPNDRISKDWGFSIHLAHMTNRKRGEWGKWTFDRQMMAIFEFDDRPHDAPKVVFRKLEGARLFRLASL